MKPFCQQKSFGKNLEKQQGSEVAWALELFAYRFWKRKGSPAKDSSPSCFSGLCGKGLVRKEAFLVTTVLVTFAVKIAIAIIHT